MNMASDEFTALMRQLNPLAQGKISAGTVPMEDEDAIIEIMPTWAESAISNGLESLLDDPAFGSFWLGLEQNPELGDLWAALVADVRESRERERRVADQDMPLDAVEIEMAWVQEMIRGRTSRLAEISGDMTHPDRKSAVGALCQFAVGGDEQAMTELNRLVSRSDVSQLLRDLAADQGNQDQSAARAVLQIISEQVRDVPAMASYAERALQGAHGILDRVRSLSAPMLSFSLQPIPGMASGSTRFIARQDGVSGQAYVDVENEGTRLLVDLVIELTGESARQWAGQDVDLIVEDVATLEQLQADGVHWFWIDPGVFRPEDPVSTGGRLTVKLGISRNAAHGNPETFHDLLEGGFHIVNRSDSEQSSQGSE